LTPPTTRPAQTNEEKDVRGYKAATTFEGKERRTLPTSSNAKRNFVRSLWGIVPCLGSTFQRNRNQPEEHNALGRVSKAYLLEGVESMVATYVCQLNSGFALSPQ
jgi:hypothetical protein